VLPVVLVRPVKSIVWSVKDVAGLAMVRMVVKPDPLSYESTMLVGPFAGVGLAT